MSQHIEVRKLSAIKEEVKGSVKDPRTGKPVPRNITGYDVLVEVINISQVKSCREFFKTQVQRTLIVGDVTIIYLFGEDKTRGKDAEMLINENINSFTDRLNAIRLPTEED